VWSDSFSFFCSLLSRVVSSARAYLVAIDNISSDILGFFMASLQINDESLLEEHVNRFVADLQDDVSLVTKKLDEFPEGLSLPLDNGG
jgi:hypothetical protein